ncbi:MAG: adenylate/guanylate cyclase domain-containing protein [Actinobacteria bacterium]|nr:adenylate/guanylate cyclase domain-containing protein [Actinomycetota bacterium]
MGIPEVRYARGDSGAVAYQVWGEGDLDLLLMTEWATSVDSIWEHPGRVRLLGFYGSLGRVIRFDCRGIGASDPVSLERLGDLDQWVRDALLVMDDVGAEHVAVSAEGFAGHAALQLAVEHRERVQRVVLLNSFARLTATHDYPFGLTDADVEGVLSLIAERWGTGEITAVSVPTLGTGALDPGFSGRTERLAGSPMVATAMVRAMYQSDVRPLLACVKVPTLIFSTGDLLYVGPEHTEYLVRHIAGAGLTRAESRSFYWGDAGFTDYAEFLTGRAGDASDRELTTVVFTDVVGSTQLAVELGDRRWRQLLDNLDQFVTIQVSRFGGRLVKLTGDGHLATFPSPQAAIDAALGILEAAPTLDISIRAGIHTGEVEHRSAQDIGGIAVHVANRVASLAGPGELLVSRTVADLVAGSGLRVDDRGEHELKGIPGRWHVFCAAR